MECDGCCCVAETASTHSVHVASAARVLCTLRPPLGVLGDDPLSIMLARVSEEPTQGLCLHRGLGRPLASAGGLVSLGAPWSQAGSRTAAVWQVWVREGVLTGAGGCVSCGSV